MKKVLCIIVGLILFAVTFVACFDAKDFEFDKFTISDLEPTVYLPLVSDTVRLDANNDYNVLYDEKGVGYLHFDIDNNNILPSVDAFFDVPDATVIVPGTSFNYPGSVTPSAPVIIPPQTYTVTYDFQDDQQIDSILFKGGNLTFNLALGAFTGSSTITIPELKKNGVAFSANIPFNTSVPIDLSGYTLKFENNNEFDVVIGPMTVQSSSAVSGTQNFDANIVFSNVEVKEVHGYFGQATESSVPVSVDISTFNQFRNNNSTVLQIKEAFLDFRVDNGVGFPIQLRIDEVISKVNNEGNTNSRSMVDSVNILAKLKSKDSYRRGEHSIGGEAFGAVLSNMPSHVEFKFSGTINPEGSKGGTVKNFLTDASSITVSNIKARIPLNFSVRDMVLEDTLDFNSSDVTFKDMELLLNVENNMPVSVTLQAYLMDENGTLMGALFETLVTVEAAKVDVTTGRVTAPSHLDKQQIPANVDELGRAKKIKVEITVASNPDSEFVRVTKDNYVYLRIGAKSKVNIDNLD